MYDIKSLIFGNGFINGTIASFLLNDATFKYDIAFTVSQSFSLAKVAFYVLARSGSPTCTIRIETDSSGRPSGTLAWANATVTAHPISATGWTGEVSLTAAGTVSPGTMYHLVVTNDAGTPATDNFSVGDNTSLFSPFSSYQLCDSTLSISLPSSYNGTTWSNRSSSPIYIVSDSGGTTKSGQPFDLTDIATVSASLSYGIKFTAPVSGSLLGAHISHLPNTGIGTVTIKLYNSSDSLLATSTVNPGYLAALGIARSSFFALFDSGSVSITAGSVYRCVLNDSGGADRIDFVTCPSTPVDYRTISPYTQSVQWTQGMVGAWTDTPGKLPVSWGLVMSSVSSGGGLARIIGG